jgi:hypothetical protein
MTGRGRATRSAEGAPGRGSEANGHGCVPGAGRPVG